MSIPAKEYGSSGLKMNLVDKNPWLIATSYYSNCIQRYFAVFNNKLDLEEELKRTDINTVCKKELNYLKSVAPEIGYKEVLGFQSYVERNTFFDEITVAKKK
jgi:hypothetical protein